MQEEAKSQKATMTIMRRKVQGVRDLGSMREEELRMSFLAAVAAEKRLQCKLAESKATVTQLRDENLGLATQTRLLRKRLMEGRTAGREGEEGEKAETPEETGGWRSCAEFRCEVRF